MVLNGQSPSWAPVCAGVPQGSILGPLFFLIYINNLSKDISSTAKLFANDTSTFSVVDVNMVVFSHKSHRLNPLSVLFNNVPVKRCPIQKHLGIHFDEKLNFNHHVKEKITKANKVLE